MEGDTAATVRPNKNYSAACKTLPCSHLGKPSPHATLMVHINHYRGIVQLELEAPEADSFSKPSRDKLPKALEC